MARIRRNWTPEEDALLQRAVHNASSQSRPLLWRELAKAVPGRSNKDCRRRWWNTLADGIVKGSWTEKEDARLIEAVQKHGPNWSQVARAVGSRNSDQCSSHWSQVLDPDINFCDWNAREDGDLLHAVLTHGTNWTTIAASHSPRRNTLALKNRYSTLRMRHENSNKFKESDADRMNRASVSSSEDATAASRRDTRTGQRIQGRISTGRGEDNGLDEEDRFDDDDDTEEEEHEDEENDNTEASPVFSATNSNNTNCAIDSERSQDSSISTPLGAWQSFAERHDLLTSHQPRNGTLPLFGENWTHHTSNSIPYASPLSMTQPLQYLGPGQDSFLQGIGAMSQSAPLGAPGGDVMDINPSSVSDPLNLANTMPAQSANGNLVGSDKDSLQPPKEPRGGSVSQGNPSITYQVTINMVCTGAQLEAVMAGVAGAGTCVNMRIDPKT